MVALKCFLAVACNLGRRHLNQLSHFVGIARELDWQAVAVDFEAHRLVSNASHCGPG